MLRYITRYRRPCVRLLQRKVKKVIALALACLVFSVAAAVFLYAWYAPKKYTGQVLSHARENGLEEELVFAVIRAESNFDKDALSRAGAVGLMQLLPSTADFIAALNKGGITDLYDAEQNIAAGCLYLRYLFERFGGVEEVLAAYNAGEGRVRVWLSDTRYSEDGKTLLHIPIEETRAYVKKVKKFYKCYKILYF